MEFISIGRGMIDMEDIMMTTMGNMFPEGDGMICIIAILMKNMPFLERIDSFLETSSWRSMMMEPAL